jgi:hypothetical protein
MLFQTAGLALAIAPLVAAIPQAVPLQCSPDNCLRALRNPNILQRAQTDCAAYLVSTSTPPAVIETEFSTISSTSTVVVSNSVENIITETSVLTVPVTATVVTSVTSTVSLAIGASAPAKRADPVVPAYASPCSGVSRYTSACSCISATAVTTTLAASTVTTTIPTTVWATETQTVDVTQDVFTTLPVTTTVTVATTTITSTVATQTVTPFYLVISDNYGTFKIWSVPNNEFVLISNDPARAAQRLELRSDGTVWADDGRTLVRYKFSGVQYVRLAPANRLNQFSQFRCAITQGEFLSCSVSDSQANTWATQLFQSNGQTVRFSNAGFFHATQQEYATNGNQFAQFPLRVYQCLVNTHCSGGQTCQSGKCKA